MHCFFRHGDIQNYILRGVLSVKFFSQVNDTRRHKKKKKQATRKGNKAIVLAAKLHSGTLRLLNRDSWLISAA